MATSRNTPRRKRTNLSGAMKDAARQKSQVGKVKRAIGATNEDWRKTATKVLGPRRGERPEPGYKNHPWPPLGKGDGSPATLPWVRPDDPTHPVDPGFNRGPGTGGSGDDQVKLPGPGVGPARRKTKDGKWVELPGPGVGGGTKKKGDGSSPLRGDPAMIEEMGGPDKPTANSNYNEFVKAHGGKSTARLGGLFSQNTGRKLTPKMRRAIAAGAARSR